MHLSEIMIITVGISLNVFSAVACFGAVLLRIEHQRLLRMLGIFCLFQVAAAVLGGQLAAWTAGGQSVYVLRNFCYVIAVAIFIGLGVFMIRKAVKNEPITERLTDIRYKQVIIAAFLTGIEAILGGFAFGLMKAGMVPVTLCTLLVTAAVVVLGLFTGYRLGYEQKTKAYAIGGILLLFSAGEIIVRYMINMHA